MRNKNKLHTLRGCRQIALRRLNQDVIVVCHQAIRMTNPVEAIADSPEHIQLGDSVFIRQEDIIAPITTRCYVIEGPGKFKS